MPADKALVEFTKSELEAKLKAAGQYEGPAGYRDTLDEYMRRANERRADQAHQLALWVGVAAFVNAGVAILALVVRVRWPDVPETIGARLADGHGSGLVVTIDPGRHVHEVRLGAEGDAPSVLEDCGADGRRQLRLRQRGGALGLPRGGAAVTDATPDSP